MQKRALAEEQEQLGYIGIVAFLPAVEADDADSDDEQPNEVAQAFEDIQDAVETHQDA